MARKCHDKPSQPTVSSRSEEPAPNESLAGRVQVLERMLKAVMEPPQAGSHDVGWSARPQAWHSLPMPNASIWAPRQTNTRSRELSPPKSPPCLGDEESDIFMTSGSPRADLSLSSQLADSEDAFGQSHRSTPKQTKEEHNNIEVQVYLPTPSKLQTLLDVYFCDVDSYFPFVERKETEPRIFETLRQLGYSEHRPQVTVGFGQLSLMSLLFNMLAIAECLNSETGACDDARPGWPLYVEGSRLAQRFSCTKNVDLDLVRHHVLGAAYLLHSEQLRSASRAVLASYQFATIIRLHDQKAWLGQSSDEVVARKRLWWTLFWLDRRIAQKSGYAYHIRNQDFSVEDFSARPKPDRISPPGDAPNVGLVHTRQETQDYLQVMINLGKLWGLIWDAFFATGADRLGNWEEIELMDTRILNVRRRLPPDLTWDPDLLHQYIAQGQKEPPLRRRIGIHTVSFRLRNDP